MVEDIAQELDMEPMETSEVSAKFYKALSDILGI